MYCTTDCYSIHDYCTKPHVHEYQRVSRLYVGMALTRLSSPNIMKTLTTPEHCPFRHITWPTGVSIYDKTLKVGKIHRYNDIRKFAKTPISPSSSFSSSSSSSSSSVNKPSHKWYNYLPSFLHEQFHIPLRSAFAQRNLCRTFPAQVELGIHVLLYTYTNAISLRTCDFT